ncbi:MAG: SNF2-related protein [Acidimicrobiales bacterium]
MLALHAIWSPGDGVRLWAEDGLALATVARRPRRDGKTRSGKREAPPHPHPFAASGRQLVDALAEHVPSMVATEVVELGLVLPGAPSRPFASPTAKHLAREPRSTATPRLRPWRAPALAFDVSDSLNVLLALADRPPTTIVPGDSLTYLVRAAGLAVDLVMRGRVLPGLVTPESGPPEARWLPAPTPADIAAAGALAAALPPHLRAQAMADGTGDPLDPPALVAEVLTALVDTTARSALAGSRLAPPRRGRAPRALPPAEAFLAALSGDDPAVDGDPDELAKLAQALDEWRRSGLRSTGALRTCFRLIPPDDDPGEAAEPWRLEFLLQSTTDPSLLVPGHEVWRSGPALASLDLGGENPRERLLGDLGHATRLVPELEAALQAPRPEGQELDTDGAHRFLSHGAPLLEQAGFGILVPPWWRTDASRLGVKLRVRSLFDEDEGDGPPSLLGMEALCDYRYEVALGDATLSLRELRELARLKAPLVRVKGRWVELRPDDLQAALEVLERQATGEAHDPVTAAEALRVGLGLDAAGVPLPVVSVEADGWLGELLSADGDRRLEPMATPAAFEGALRPYQERGLSWLWFLDHLGLGACLADDMGLGKTPQLLALLLAEREKAQAANGKARRPKSTLLVCPMSVVGNWQREAECFAPSLTVHVHHGAERETGKAFAQAVKKADLVLTTYALAARDRELLEGVDWGRVALDEAQNVKNAGAKQARAVRSLRAARRVALTGTPVENRLADLWSIMEFLNPGLLGSQDAFRSRFAARIERYGDNQAARTLKRVTGPFILRRLKTDRSIIADLPDKVQMKVLCNLTREQATLYQAVVNDMLVRLEETEGIQRKGVILSTMTKLKQVCNHPAHLLGDGSRLEGRSGKLARLEEILEEVAAEGDRALCFTQFTEMGQLLHGHLRGRLGCDVPFLHGGVPKRERDEMVTRFQAGEGAPVFLLSLKAGGVGLNLTAANHVVHFDRWWNPAVEDQATDRAFRIGQRKDVQVRKFVCVGTLEERIDQMIEAKRDLAERIVGSGEAWLTELSTEQIRELVALSADAVAEG